MTNEEKKERQAVRGTARGGGETGEGRCRKTKTKKRCVCVREREKGEKERGTKKS